jgi:hypothetical protein
MGEGMITLEQAQQAIADAATVYTVDGTGVVLIEAGTDNDGVDYAAYLMADPDDNEAIRYTEDLARLHSRQQVSTKRLTDPCMCEHTNHFDDQFGPRVDRMADYLI